MLNFISERHRVTVKEKSLDFFEKETDELRFSIPLYDSQIVPLKDVNGEMVPCAEEECSYWENYQKMSEDPAYYCKEVTREYSYVEDAVVRCDCGEEFRLHDMFYGSCGCPKCGQWYNLFGQEVCSPEEQMHCEDW